MTRKSNRPTPKEIDEAVAQIRALLEPSGGARLNVNAMVYLWATDRMTSYLDDWSAHHCESRKGQRVFMAWLRDEPRRLERIIKTAIRRLTRESGPAANDTESSE